MPDGQIEYTWGLFYLGVMFMNKCKFWKQEGVVTNVCKSSIVQTREFDLFFVLGPPNYFFEAADFDSCLLRLTPNYFFEAADFDSC